MYSYRFSSTITLISYYIYDNIYMPILHYCFISETT